MAETALLIVDLQRDFFESPAVGNLRRAVALPGVRSLLEQARAWKWRIFHVHTRHAGVDTLPLFLRRSRAAAYCLEGEPGVQGFPELAREAEVRIYKQAYSAFQGTDLAERLQGIGKLVLAGLNADCCILHTAFDAGTRYGLEVYIPAQAVGAASLKQHVCSLHLLGKSVAAVLDLARLLKRETPEWDLALGRGELQAELLRLLAPLYQQVEQTVAALRARPLEEAVRQIEELLAPLVPAFQDGREGRG